MGRGTVPGLHQDRCKISQLNSLAQAVARQDQVSEKSKSRAEPPGDTVRPRVTTKVARGNTFYLEAEAWAASLERRHHFSSWLISVTSMPGITMNLQESISRGSSSSGSWQVTRQYWQS
jgi:hypothetical protein